MSKNFNGTTDLINLGSPAALDNIGGINGARSIVAWIYPTGWGEASFGRIFNKGAPTSGWLFYVANVAPLASLTLGIVGTTDANAFAAASTLSLNTWQFIAGTWAGNIGVNAPRLWKGTTSQTVAETSYDSQAVGSGAQDDDNLEVAYIGNRGAADRTFDGLIGHVSLWAGELTQPQLEHLRIFPYAPMHRFSGKTLKGYYPLFESAAATCRDHSGNGSHGTVTGTSVGAEPPFAWTRSGGNGILVPAVAAVSEHFKRGIRSSLKNTARTHLEVTTA